MRPKRKRIKPTKLKANKETNSHKSKKPKINVAASSLTSQKNPMIVNDMQTSASIETAYDDIIFPSKPIKKRIIIGKRD